MEIAFSLGNEMVPGCRVIQVIDISETQREEFDLNNRLTCESISTSHGLP